MTDRLPAPKELKNLPKAEDYKDVEIESKEPLEDLNIEPISKDDLFQMPEKKIVKKKKKRQMSDKQKAHLQKLIASNKARAKTKKEKKIKTKEVKSTPVIKKNININNEVVKEKNTHHPTSPSMDYKKITSIYDYFEKLHHKRSVDNEEKINREIDRRMAHYQRKKSPKKKEIKNIEKKSTKKAAPVRIQWKAPFNLRNKSNPWGM